ncbi:MULTISPECIES: S9 family peptidase [Idiomarina]|jgi:dipeptidyl-peptidase 4|uniref:S9 family peptidase n=2 Tax=Idiomarina baltica TaxID=190892 RepID=A0A348WP16_9GAMM|nr:MULTISPECIES: DPP IV N-terminal domain-containing protein [Idiomarina]MEC8924724.1 DPP IV N-terminal domain-containing protein [Pseudomonadota bacterium]HAE90113.1 S9 family peptidase [Idiomarina sp.]HAR56278.1 S9 family peptidase [Idiomarina baltica]
MMLRFSLLSASVILASVVMQPQVESKELSIERIFSSPSLSGDSMRALRFSPDGQRLTYLKGRADDASHYDLWSYNLATEKHQRLVNADDVFAGEEVLSDEEKARRERLRLSGSGIVSYQWSAQSDALLFPLAGDVYYYSLETGKARQITHTEAFETDAKLSPQGHYVSYIREQNLYVYSLETGTEQAITRSGKDTIKYGMAEFVAQEEIDRMTGYWWSPNERKIALTRVDESPVDIAVRSEIYADHIDMIEQRYPFAGTPNVDIDLGVVDVDFSGADNLESGIKWLGLDELGDGYLARVKWLKDSQRFSYQWQSRDQQRLDLHMVDVNDTADNVILTETSDSWVNLNDDLYFLDDNKHFIWASERSGYKHLYLYRVDGGLIRQLTSGDWQVDELAAIDEKTGVFYFTGREKSPLELHLYRNQLNTTSPATPSRITEQEGMHHIQFAADGSSYVDTFESYKQPPQISLNGPTGKRLTWLKENKIDDQHPLKPYWRDWLYPEFGTLEAEDGQTLYYQLTKPANFDSSKQYPVMVYVYGGPGAQVVTKGWGNYLVQYMAQQGYVVFSVDNRGSFNRGKAFEAPIYKNMGTPEIADQIRGVEFLRTLDYVDPERIGIHGHSYGGYMTLMAMFKASDYFAAGVSGAPVTDWRLYDTHYTERYMGMPQQGDAYEKASVFPYTDGLSGDLMIYHGMADDNVLFTHSTKLYKQLQDNAQPFQMMNYPGKKHSLNGKNTRIHRYQLIANFFQQTLKQ